MALPARSRRGHPENVSVSVRRSGHASGRPRVRAVLLVPLIAEYLLGDFTVAGLSALFLLGPMYGGAAVLIREVVRRAGRGWPSLLLMALACGVLEEAVVTQSLFNPNYAGHHLLADGFVPALGIAIPWTLFVLTLHTVWSIAVPIALVEGLVPARRTTPWLRTPGLAVAAVLFVLGGVVTTSGSYADGHFRAPWPQLLVSVVVAAGLVGLLLAVASRTAKAIEAPANEEQPALVG
jgi:hypothetical protein